MGRRPQHPPPEPDNTRTLRRRDDAEAELRWEEAAEITVFGPTGGDGSRLWRIRLSPARWQLASASPRAASSSAASWSAATRQARRLRPLLKPNIPLALSVMGCGSPDYANPGSGSGGDEVNERTTPYEHGDQRSHRPEHDAPHQFVPHHGDAPANESAQVENDDERR